MNTQYNNDTYGPGGTDTLYSYPIFDLCNQYNYYSYTDWFIPSTGKLALMYQNLYDNGYEGFSASNYRASNDSTATGLVAWHLSNSETTTHNVLEKDPNNQGVYDMNGNVFGWCIDLYDDYEGPYPYRAMRSGTWINQASTQQIGYIIHYSQYNGRHHLGFRFAKTK